ncbi:ATP-dependent DNA helicase PIF1-like [Amphibalanus amphitrite]|uniref:ATP-dependent DNA helicase PIF1-like n=1 Tax=Amphibalanus amphitrite TaxID=1232801 RepID=UPI001C8FD150|nr:ATP-dependent DNA helicase PIF1-like [Amphibalanus amphitrite]XP_043221534.1 ATP-dependent DNA helicase PIF1-like [Amphibalanus amphitrite]
MSAATGESPKSSLSCPVISASVTIDQLDGKGSVLRSARHPTASLSLCRSEQRELVLLLQTARQHQIKVVLKEVTLHRRFLREGKATLVVRGQQLRLLVSNAPPAQLLTFLRVLSAKLALQTAAGRPTCVRDRLLRAPADRRLDEVSPLTADQLGKLQGQQAGGQQPQQAGPAPLTARDTNVPAAPRAGKRPAAASGAENQAKRPAKVLTMSQFLNPLPITKEQRAVLEVATSNRNVFFTGGAGTGKSFLLQRIISALPPESTWVTASTGAAACQVQGVTLHSFAGLGRGTASLEQCVELASRPGVLQHWKRCKHLVIDEISMVDADFFQKLEYVARMVRGSTAPFGGIHLVLCGDFLQLPPVVARSDKPGSSGSSSGGGGGRFCFESDAWTRCIDVTMELRQIHRQDDPEFIRILQNVRVGRCTEEDARRLAATATNSMELPAGIAATRLCTHRADVDQINQHKLAALTGLERQYLAEDSVGASATVLDTLTPVAGRLRLRPGAQVMLAKNLDVRAGLVNGARGVVVGFSAGTPFGGQTELPEVQFACGVRRVLTPERWTARSSGGAGTLCRRQLPLRLAWAFSVHKSQGMTLDCVEMALSRSFEPGQAYVALSRARNLRSLRVLDFTAACVRAHPAVLRFYARLQCV